jgi:AAA15 family ATPase/GTPase
MLYSRGNGRIELDSSLEHDRQFLLFAFRGTRDNQLFLTNSVSQRVRQFKPIHDWFKNTLQMVAPDARFGGGALFFDSDHPFTVTMNEKLRDFDTGISHLGNEFVPFENVQLPEAVKADIQDTLGDQQGAIAEDSSNNQFLIARKDGDLIAWKRVAVHKMADGTEAHFEVSQESDGSQRLIDLVPAFLDLSTDASQRVYVIDEVDRSLHTLLTRRLLEDYLYTRNAGTRTQLLLTTHDVLLMDQRWLRRDEMWVTERDNSGASSLFSFSEYRDVRYDKDIRKSYLQGRLGGIPRIISSGSMPGAASET